MAENRIRGSYGRFPLTLVDPDDCQVVLLALIHRFHRVFSLPIQPIGISDLLHIHLTFVSSSLYIPFVSLHNLALFLSSALPSSSAKIPL